MKTNRFALLLNVLVVCGVLFMSACGTSTPTPTTVAPATAAPATAAPATAAPTVATASVPTVLNMPEQIAGGRPVTITVVGRPPDSQPTLLAAWAAQAARFTKKYPNVTIQGSDYTYTPDSFAALVAGKQVPTLFQVYLTDPGKMIDQGVAADLTSFFQAQKLDTIYNPQILSIVSKDGKIYGIPMNAYAMGLAYNIPMLKAAGYDAPPTTWDQLATMAQKLTNRDAGVAGFSMITDGSAATGWHMTTLAFTFGLKNTDIVQQTNGKYVAGFDNASTLAALSFVKDLRWKYDVLPRENLAWDTNGQALATGKAAMVMMAGDQFTWIRQTYPDAPINDFGFAPLPAGPDGKSVSLVGGNIAMVSAAATPDQIEAAAYYRLWTQFDAGEIQATYDAGKADPTTVVGAPELPLYTGDYQTQTAALQKFYANLPVDNYALFMNGIVSGQVGVSPEPLIAGQEFYGAMGSVVSTLVADQSKDPATELTAAAKTFQTNVLDKLK
ncbi:MAG TPA: extracellular solute-binding protein [Anaerolineales bacterium]|nr:extracellular solute-binding protein [Anaerolineales bacterium]